jgi:hypothetical protein
MCKLILDRELRAKLNGFNDEMELVDEQGNTLGHFLPEAQYRKLAYAWANAQVTDDELIKASQEPGGRPLSDVWNDLSSR